MYRGIVQGMIYQEKGRCPSVSSAYIISFLRKMRDHFIAVKTNLFLKGTNNTGHWATIYYEIIHHACVINTK